MEAEKENVFEASKITYQCKKCGTNMMLGPGQLKKCPCGSMDLIEGKSTKLHVIVGLYGGVLQDVRVFTDDAKATKCEKQICKEYKVPFNYKKRKQYYDSNGENEVYHQIVNLE